MSKLGDLINKLHAQIKSHDPKIKVIKHPIKLLNSLRKLNGVIGMERVKDDIADQVIYLIMTMRNGEHNAYMLNTIFYGPPGVGKTKIGVILSEIWYGLGFIGHKTITVKSTITNSMNFDSITFLIISLYLIYALQFLALIYRKIGLFYFAVIIGLILLFLLLIAWWWYASSSISTTTYEDVVDPELIKIVSRKDFVAEYVGQTAIKTEKLLNKYRGKVLFIDEAYSLLNDSRDPFGLEALTTLNQFMSENPNDIVIIFAGYKDKMQSGIFSIQPGLPRRCMWHFECDGYNGAELYSIFKSQLAIDGWEVEEDPRIEKIFLNNERCFPSFGGDTERLCFFAKLESNREAFHNNGEMNHTLTYKQVVKGLNMLKQNNIQHDAQPSTDDQLSQLLSKMRGPPLHGD